MAIPVAPLQFRLDASNGIGRNELLKLWSAACRSEDAAVSRVESGGGYRSGFGGGRGGFGGHVGGHR